MQTMRTMVSRACWTAAALAGCTPLELGQAVVESEVPPCGTFTCSNSWELSYRGFHGFRLSGLPNEQGMTIRAKEGQPLLYDKHGTPWALEVTGTGLRGRRTGSTIRHSMLEDAEIIIDQENQPSFAIHIDAARTIFFPFGDRTQALDAYVLSWRALDEPPHPFSPDRRLCNGPMLFPSPDEEGAVFLGMQAEETVVFAGDSLDIDTAVTHCDPDWFNFGCAGKTLAKLLLTRNTCQSQERPSKPDEQALEHERQAALRLLIADYCGTGAHLTVNGEPLVWMGGALPAYATDPSALEARWDEHGATCLDTPRLVANAPPSDAGFSPNIWDDIAAACPGGVLPPRCIDPDPQHVNDALRISANRLVMSQP